MLSGAVPQLVALALGLVAASVLILAAGYNPLVVFGTLFQSALGTSAGQASVLTYTGIYTLTALAFLIPGRASIWNVGANGQVYLGGIMAGLVAIYLPLPPGLWPVAAIILACLAGGVWGLIPGLLEVYRNASAIVTTIMMNYIANALIDYVILGVIVTKVPSVAQYNLVTVAPNVTIPALPGFSTSIMVVVAVLVAVGTMYMLQRTTLGYRIRATGLGRQPAEAKGINPKTSKAMAMFLGGAIAGLAGAGDVLGIGHACGTVACLETDWAGGWFFGEGFAGMAAALVAANNPIGSLFSAAFFSILVSGSSAVFVRFSGLNLYFFYAVQGLIITFMAAPYLSKRILSLVRRKRWT
jgi:simple sugar transport system permease protein